MEIVESVLEQSYDDVELIFVGKSISPVFEYVQSRFGELKDVILHNNDENRGISYSRTKGAELASGDIVLFIDDDTTAEPEWVEAHVRVYEDDDVIAVAGPVKPD